MRHLAHYRKASMQMLLSHFLSYTVIVKKLNQPIILRDTWRLLFDIKLQCVSETFFIIFFTNDESKL